MKVVKDSSMIGSFNFCRTSKNRKRVGRSGAYGGTSGRGHKGMKARSGGSVKGFEGGQTPIFRRLPRRGFVSNKIGFMVLTADKVVGFANNIKGGVLDLKEVVKSGKYSGVKVILSKKDFDAGEVKKVVLNSISAGAEKLFKKKGIEVVKE